MITNRTNMSLAMAVWAVDDDYDYIDKENYISVTSLIKPVKQIILGKRADSKKTSDVSEFIARALGTSIHAGAEKAWGNYQTNMRKLGYSEDVVSQIVLNPTKGQDLTDRIPIYVEQRSFAEIGGFTLGGKYDMVTDGLLQDIKTTSAYTWLYGGRDDEHMLQGSMYKFLNQDIITDDIIRINYLFTDWQSSSAKQNPKYPQSRLEYKDIPLMSVKETEQWILAKLETITKYMDAPESAIPECTDEDLWRSASVYKYYADPTKTTGRATKNFDTLLEANSFMATKGVGVVLTIPGAVKRCAYCPAADICEQRKRYFPED